MLIAKAQCNDHTLVLLIQPNKNLTWNETRLVFLFLASCVAAVAAYFLTLGAWLVLPFAGPELLIIGLGFYLHSCHAHQQQVVRIDANNISVVDARKRGPELCFPRVWVKIVHTGNPGGWYPSRLFIGAHGKYIEIGKYLIESERETLANNLRCTIQGA